MKNVTCGKCGETRESSVAEEYCDCGDNCITFNHEVLTDIINSRSEARMLCACCKHEVFGVNIDAYPHTGGWKINGLKGYWWLSVRCPACNYETSFSKFGIVGNLNQQR